MHQEGAMAWRKLCQEPIFHPQGDRGAHAGAGGSRLGCCQVVMGAAQGGAGVLPGPHAWSCSAPCSSLAPMPGPALLHAPTSSAELCSSRHWQVLVLISCPRAGDGATKARHLPDDLHHHYDESVFPPPKLSHTELQTALVGR